MTTTAKIAAKGTQSTGITEDIAKRLHDNLGRTIVAVVELRAESRGENLNGDEKVILGIQRVEVAPNEATENHLLELAKSFHYERRLAEDGPGLEFEGDEPAPKVTDVLARGERHVQHPYLASTLSLDDNAVCDVCGQHEGAAVHGTHEAIPDVPLPEADDTEDTTGDQDDDTDEQQPDAVDDLADTPVPDPGDEIDPQPSLRAVPDPFNPGGARVTP